MTNGLFSPEPSRNIRNYSWYYALTGLTFTVPIWVAFYLRTITLEQTAFINAIADLIVVSLQIPTGALADLLGRKIMVTIGQAMRALMFFMLPFATNFTSILMLNLIMAIGESMGSGADSALLYDTLKSEGRESEFGLIYTKILTYYRICLITGSLIGGLLYTYSYGLPYYLRSIAFLFSAFSIFKMVEPKREVVRVNLVSTYKKTLDGLKGILRSSFVRKLSLYYIAVGSITWSCLYYFNQPFAYAFGWSTTQMSYITAGLYLISSLVVYYLTSSKNILTRERVYLGFPILMIVALLPGLFVGKWVGLILLVLIQIAGSSRFSILDRYVNLEFDSSHRATSLSSLNMLVSLGMAGLLFVGGRIQGFADTRMVFTLLGLLSVMVVTPLAIILMRDRRQHKLGAIQQRYNKAFNL